MKTISGLTKAHTLALSVIFGLSTLALSTQAISGVRGTGGNGGAGGNAGNGSNIEQIEKNPKPDGIIGDGFKKVF